MFKTRLFDKALDHATSELLLEPDLESMLQTCDEIRQKEITPKSALGILKRKLRDENPHVISYSLAVLECWMKNCGPPMHMEVGSRDFMDFLKDLVKDIPDKPKEKLLELMQTWSYAFKDKHRMITETYNSLKSEGYEFPEFVESESHFDAEMAPEWKDSQNCYHCRAEFGLITRKHHCRNCGEIFCGDCTKKQCVIPRFGYEREVRVCDACFDDLTKKASSAPGGGGSKQSSSSGSSRNGSTNQDADRQRREREIQLQEEEELQLAMAISQSEFEQQAAKSKSKTTSKTVTSSITQQQQATPASPAHVQAAANDVSSELDRYLDRAYWERQQQKIQQQQQQVAVAAPSAPSPTDSIAATLANNNHAGAPPKDTASANSPPAVQIEEAEKFVRVLSTQVAAFLSRLKFDQQRGRDVTSDAAVQSQFVQLSRAHDVLLSFMREADDRRNYYESLQEKLVQLTDAREALDALRTEQVERRRRQAEEEDRQRRIQMASKLDYMRVKKHEYLEMQRRQALARLEEQQRDMAMRLEQQKAMRLSQNPQMYYQQMMGLPTGVPTGPMPPPGYFPAPVPGQLGGGFQQQPPPYQQIPTWNPVQHPGMPADAQAVASNQPQPPQQWAAPPPQTVNQPPQQPPLQYVPGAIIQTPQMQAQGSVVPQVVPGSVPLQQQQQMMGPPQPQLQQGPPQQQQYYQPQQFAPPQMATAVVPNQAQPPQPAIAELIQFD